VVYHKSLCWQRAKSRKEDGQELGALLRIFVATVGADVVTAVIFHKADSVTLARLCLVILTAPELAGIGNGAALLGERRRIAMVAYVLTAITSAKADIIALAYLTLVVGITATVLA
jgi:hypothetical protein